MLFNILLSLTYIKEEKVLILGQIFKMKISTDLCVITSHESQNHIFRFWCLCMCLCLSVFVTVINITQKQITREKSNLILCIFICSCYLKLFIKIGQKLCVQEHTKWFWYIKVFGGDFLLLSFCVFRLLRIKANKKNIHFSHAQKNVNNTIVYEGHSSLV